MPVPIKIKRTRSLAKEETETLKHKHFILTNDGEYKQVSNSEYFGPGTWHTIHMMALEADKMPSAREPFIFLLNTLAKYFACPECRRHYNEYLKANPPSINRTYNGIINNDEEAIEKGIYFKWSVDFHNTVNKRLSNENSTKRKIFTYTEAYTEFKNNVEAIDCDSCQIKN